MTIAVGETIDPWWRMEDRESEFAHDFYPGDVARVRSVEHRIWAKGNDVTHQLTLRCDFEPGPGRPKE
jgi:hypothetical protein